jgi:hypothetical protein
VKKKVVATRVIAAAETRVSAVAFELAGCLGRDDEDVILAGASEISAAEIAACDGTNCG